MAMTKIAPAQRVPPVLRDEGGSCVTWSSCATNRPTIAALAVALRETRGISQVAVKVGGHGRTLAEARRQRASLVRLLVVADAYMIS